MGGGCIDNIAYSQPFYFPGDSRGCLLIHGFTGSPSEMLPLGQYLNNLGYTVHGVRLKGHGTTLQDMAHTRWKDWLDSAIQGYKKLEPVCEDIYVVGFSMGGIIALNLALKHNFKAVAVVSAPIFIMNKKAFLVPLVKLFKKYEIKKKKTNYEKDIDKYMDGYDRTPLVCVQSLLQLINLTKKNLKYFNNPIIIVQSKDDITVEYRSAQYIYDNIQSERKKLYWLEEAGHMVVLSKEREEVFNEIQNFFVSNK